MCGTFILNDKQGNGTEVFWPVLGSAVKIALALGLHRDGTLFQGLSEHETEERRQVWWELVTYDRLQAMCFARPYATSNRASDTKLPHCDDEILSDFDIFHTAKYRLIALFEKVIDVQTQVAPVSQAAVKALDKEVEDCESSIWQQITGLRDSQKVVTRDSAPLGPDRGAAARPDDTSSSGMYERSLWTSQLTSR